MSERKLYIYSFAVGESRKETGRGIVWARDAQEATKLIQEKDEYWTIGKKIVVEEFTRKMILKRYSWVE
jgi:hypothetical protein